MHDLGAGTVNQAVVTNSGPRRKEERKKNDRTKSYVSTRVADIMGHSGREGAASLFVDHSHQDIYVISE